MQTNEVGPYINLNSWWTKNLNVTTKLVENVQLSGLGWDNGSLDVLLNLEQYI